MSLNNDFLNILHVFQCYILKGAKLSIVYQVRIVNARRWIRTWDFGVLRYVEEDLAIFFAVIVIIYVGKLQGYSNTTF